MQMLTAGMPVVRRVAEAESDLKAIEDSVKRKQLAAVPWYEGEGAVAHQARRQALPPDSSRPSHPSYGALPPPALSLVQLLVDLALEAVPVMAPVVICR